MPLSQKLTITIADDHPLILKGFVSTFEDYPDIDIIDYARNGVELLESLARRLPDIVVLDVEMPLMNGIEVLKRIVKEFPKIRTIVMSFYSDLSFISHCIALGANAYLTKGSDPNLIVESVYKVHEDGYYFSKTVLDAIAKNRKSTAKGATQQLSEREVEVLKLICLGYMNKEIASKLNIFIGTVDFHKKNISQKTGCKTKASLVLYAIEHNIITLSKSNDLQIS